MGRTAGGATGVCGLVTGGVGITGSRDEDGAVVGATFPDDAHDDVFQPSGPTTIRPSGQLYSAYDIRSGSG